ncbi:magnesium and cobalt transport protein CorA [Actinocorallia longicatena]|uniref:Magnesium and cobalt transport protein CorA n=1 Tax=Actinocorallia longicatena TaxID=111803 RepID=A0ABP6QLC2_9ACTN
MAMTRVRPSRSLFFRSPRPAACEAVPCKDSAVKDWAVYIDGHRVVTESVADAVRLVRDGRLEPYADPAGFVWVGLHDPESAELEKLAELFGLPPLAVEDAIKAHQRPKLERYDDMQFFVLKTVGYTDRPTGIEVETGEIMIFCGPDFVVTVRYGDYVELGSVRRRLEANPERLDLGPTSVLHAVADRVVDEYLRVAEAVQEDVDEVEESVFSSERTDDASRIYRLKRETIQLKRAVGPLSGPLRTLCNRRMVPTEIREYLRDVEDHLTRVREQVDACDELLNPILQAHMTQVTVGDNKDMRKISAWGAILMLPTAIAGIYGMNFDYMPELRWTGSYYVVLGVIAIGCTMLYRGFRRNGWL